MALEITLVDACPYLVWIVSLHVWDVSRLSPVRKMREHQKTVKRCEEIFSFSGT
jgi:hypothetical protein